MALLNNITFEGLTDDDWFIVEKTCEVLGIFYAIAEEISTEKIILPCRK